MFMSEQATPKLFYKKPHPPDLAYTSQEYYIMKMSLKGLALSLILSVLLSSQAFAGLITATTTSQINYADVKDPLNNIVLQEYLNEFGNGGDLANFSTPVSYISVFTVNGPASILTFKKTTAAFEHNMTVQLGDDPSNSVTILWAQLMNFTDVAFYSDTLFTKVRITLEAISSRHGEFIKTGARIEDIFTNSMVIPPPPPPPTDVTAPASFTLLALSLVGIVFSCRKKAH